MERYLELSDTLSLSLDMHYHIIISGVSGTGKTSLLYLVLMFLARNLNEYSCSIEHPIRIIDPKCASLASLKYALPDKHDVACDVEGALVLLHQFYDEITARGKLLDNPDIPLDSDFQTLCLPPSYIVLDEAVDLMNSAKNISTKTFNELQNIITNIITKGRQLGCILIMTVMRGDTSFINGVARSSMQAVLLATKTHPIDKDNAIMFFGSSKGLMKPSRDMDYYGYMMSESTREPQLFLTPTYPKDLDVRKVIKHYLSRPKLLSEPAKQLPEPQKRLPLGVEESGA